MDRRTVSFLRDLATEGKPSVVVRGECMEPRLRSGETVTVRRRWIYLPGDVVVFQTPAGAMAAHRVIGWRPAGLVTKGDHCEVHDAPIASADIVGKVERPVSLRERFRAICSLARIVARRLAR